MARSRPIIQAGCWAHAWSKFYEAYQLGEEGAAHYLLLIRELYGVERALSAEATPAQVIERRRASSRPVLEQIRCSLDEDVARHPPKSAMADAIGYARSQWPKLSAYVDHGQVRLQFFDRQPLASDGTLRTREPAAMQATRLHHTPVASTERNL